MTATAPHAFCIAHGCREPVAAPMLALYRDDAPAVMRPPAVPEPPRVAAVPVRFVGDDADLYFEPEVEPHPDEHDPPPVVDPVIVRPRFLSAALRVLEWSASHWFTARLTADAQPIAGVVRR